MRARPKTPTTLADLIPDDRNANRGTDRGRQLLHESLRTLGAARSVVLDRRGRVIAGNKTVEQAIALGLRLRVIATRGDVIVAVQRTDLDLRRDPRARELALADNRVGEVDLEWDPTMLEEFRKEGLNIGAWWTDEEFARTVGSLIAPDPKDDVAVSPGPTSIRRGDYFMLGRHCLGCGDATDPADVARLVGDAAPNAMLTDPPYGVDYQPQRRNDAYPTQRTAVGRVMNDHRADWEQAYALFTGNVVYSWHASVNADTVAIALRGAGFEIRSQIIWVKPHLVLSRGAYHYRHEPAWYAVRRGKTAAWYGDRSQTTVWEVPNLNAFGGTRTGENAPTGHSTQKPVRLFEIPILNHTTIKGSIYDPFCGSGSSLIAAEKTGRRAFVMDLDPQYVQVTLTRWETYTGQRAKRLGGAGRGRRRA